MFFPPANPILRQGACTSLPEDGKRQFFDTRSSRGAKAICGQCDVQDECLRVALDFESQPGVRQRHGVWGGMAAHERDRKFGKLD